MRMVQSYSRGKLSIKRQKLTVAAFFITLAFCFTLWLNIHMLNTVNERRTPPAINLKRKSFLVNTPMCHIEDAEAHDVSIQQYIYKIERESCTKESVFTEVIYDEINDEHRLQLTKKAQKLGKLLSCCFQVVNGNGFINDNIYDISKCQLLNTSTVLSEKQQFLVVRCLNKDKKETYINSHATVIKTSHVKNKIMQDTHNRPNVLFIGFDSMSRLNFHRTMPLTRIYLKSKGWIEIKGYNKIADNTFPNLMALLTGLSVMDIPNGHEIINKNYLDDYAYIWKAFANRNYITVYGEDYTTMSTFNCVLKGFLKPPTDYYPRPYFLATVDLIKSDNSRCYGSEPLYGHLFQYMKQFLNIFKNNNFFAFFWFNSFSHNSLNYPSSQDENVFEIFESLEIYNNTIILFLSDHGARTGGIRQTQIGWLEERLPFLYIWIPTWIRESYPSKYINILKNTNKLVSTFDIHLTVRDILNSSGQLELCKNCQSLFQPVPDNRSCSDAGISPHWCTCHELVPLSINDKYAIPIAEFALSKLNDFLMNVYTMKIILPYYTCAQLYLTNILYFRRKLTTDIEEYIVGFEVKPSYATFEATVRITDSGFTLMGPLSRTNEFGAESHCITDMHARLYCYCEYRIHN